MEQGNDPVRQLAIRACLEVALSTDMKRRRGRKVYAVQALDLKVANCRRAAPLLVIHHSMKPSIETIIRHFHVKSKKHAWLKVLYAEHSCRVHGLGSLEESRAVHSVNVATGGVTGRQFEAVEVVPNGSFRPR
jgi:hypothetical protein